MRWVCVVVAVLMMGWIGALEARGEGRAPNVVFLFADDLGYGDLGCYGHPLARTPNLDRLAREGTRFEQFYVTGVTCCPSRTGFMTSRFPARFAKYPADAGFGDRVTVTELLKRAGYATGHVGKWHIGPETRSGTYGIDVIGASDEARTRKNVSRGRDANIYDDAIRFIEQHRDRPFYLNVWGHISHFPVNPAANLVDAFGAVTVRDADFPAAMREKFESVRAAGGDVDASMRRYLADVASLDAEVGRLLARLDELGLRDNTIVVFSSDHGPADTRKGSKEAQEPDGREELRMNMLGSPGPLRGGKHTMYEGGVRVPFIVRWPGRVPAGRVESKAVISGIDWLPTLCRIAGVKIDAAEFDGEDVSAAWLGEPFTRTQPLMWKTSNPRSEMAMRDGEWKLHLPNRRRGEVELYDVTADPAEKHNLAAARPEVVERLSQRLQAWNATLPTEYEKSKDKED